jgi:hypothetical protein
MRNLARILCAIDLEKASEPAFDRALRLAMIGDAKLFLLHATPANVRLKQRNPPAECVRRQRCVLSKSTMHNGWRTLERRPGKQHGLPEIVHPRQMRRPVNMRDIVENRSEEVIVSHASVEKVHEARHIARVGDIEPRLIHVKLHVNRGAAKRLSLRLSNENAPVKRYGVDAGATTSCCEAIVLTSGFAEPMTDPFHLFS